MIRVYTKPNCPQCVATKRYLDQRGAAYTTEPITDAVIEAAKSLGITSAPIVCHGTEAFGGFNPAALDAAIGAL